MMHSLSEPSAAPHQQPVPKHLVIINAGEEDGGARATLAFALAISLQSMGADVAIYLDAAGAVWALEGASRHVAVRGFDALPAYMEIFKDVGGRTYVHHAALTQLPEWDAYADRHRRYGQPRRDVTPAGVATLASLLLDRRNITF